MHAYTLRGKLYKKVLKYANMHMFIWKCIAPVTDFVPSFLRVYIKAYTVYC